jgi:hypothetical protein
MPELLHHQYLTQARRLARLDLRRPQQANLRRATSTAYYALFHFLIDQACRLLLGQARDQGGMRMLMARAFVHGEMAEACKTFRGGNLPVTIQNILPGLNVPSDVRQLAGLFILAQEHRHAADYDLHRAFTRAEVLLLIDRIEAAVVSWDSIRSLPATRLLLMSLLLWKKLGSR